jgi:hypothetical protein
VVVVVVAPGVYSWGAAESPGAPQGPQVGDRFSSNQNNQASRIESLSGFRGSERGFVLLSNDFFFLYPTSLVDIQLS